MNQLMPFAIATGLVAVSLGAAYVLFRFLKSTAVIKGTKWQAGGALAGFLLILSYSYSITSHISRETCTMVDWTVTGYVTEKGIGPYPGIQVSQVTIPALSKVDSDGRFVLEGARVLRTATDPYPRLHFEGDRDHDPIVEYQITPDRADIDFLNSTITLKEALELELHQQSQFSTAGPGQ